jgi:hypothetical protein
MKRKMRMIRLNAYLRAACQVLGAYQNPFLLKRIKEIEGGNAKENARLIREIQDGEKEPKRDMVLLNAAAAFVAAGLDENLEGVSEEQVRPLTLGRQDRSSML